MKGFGIGLAALVLVFAARGEDSSDTLIQAIRNNDLTSLKTALRKGADVNTRDRRGSTLLMHAAIAGSPDALKLLIDSGADVNAKNSFDETALLLCAADPQKARILIDKGADVNARSKTVGRTPLMIAANCDGCSETVKLLLDKGADAKAVDAHKTGALALAADGNNLENVRLLLAKGAVANVQDEAGNSPLLSAASNCNHEAAKLFLAKGADVNAANTSSGEVKFGKIQLIHLTPLMLAATFCSPEILQTLLDAGANVKEEDIRGMTPLVFAVSSERQDPSVVRLLLKAGAEVNAKTKTGETALDWAKKFGNPDVISTLAAAGAREGVPYTAPQRPATPVRTVAESAQAGATLVQKAATEFFQQSGCVGCHHQNFAIMAVSAARSSGVKVDEGPTQAQVKMIEGQWNGLYAFVLEHVDTGGAVDPAVYSLLSLGAARYPANTTTDALVHYIAATQHRDGSWWLGGIARAPLEEGRILRSAIAMRALQLYGSAGRKAEMDQRVARTRGYLLDARALTIDDAAMQVAGLHWAGAPPDRVRSLAQTLIARQRQDGGWGPNRNLPSDAYATGETLWALKESGVLAASDPVYQRGVKYLLSTQWKDGSWYVRSRAPKFQPYFQSGFPYDHDQWISSAATSWAVMALAPAAETTKTASR
jgi:ankyrin repeat protein